MWYEATSTGLRTKQLMAAIDAESIPDKNSAGTSVLKAICIKWKNALQIDSAVNKMKKLLKTF